MISLSAPLSLDSSFSNFSIFRFNALGSALESIFLLSTGDVIFTESDRPDLFRNFPFYTLLWNKGYCLPEGMWRVDFRIYNAMFNLNEAPVSKLFSVFYQFRSNLVSMVDINKTPMQYTGMAMIRYHALLPCAGLPFFLIPAA
jgi:hypothetical protein